MFRSGDGAEPPAELLAMVCDVCACSIEKARRALALAGNDVATAIDLVLNGHPEVNQDGRAASVADIAFSSTSPAEDAVMDGEMEPDDLIELINWGLTEYAAKHALLHNNFKRQAAIEWWFGLPEGEQIRLSETVVSGPWELYKLASSVQSGQLAADSETVSQLLKILGAEGVLLDNAVLRALMQPKADLSVLLKCGVLDRMFEIVREPNTPSNLRKEAFKFARRLCRDSSSWQNPQSGQTHVHKYHRKQCMVCTQCGFCTGYGPLCVNTPAGKRPRQGKIQCGCGVGDSGCIV